MITAPTWAARRAAEDAEVIGRGLAVQLSYCTSILPALPVDHAAALMAAMGTQDTEVIGEALDNIWSAGFA